MRIKLVAVATALACIAPIKASAQDSWTQHWGQQQQTLGNDMLNRSMLRQSQARNGRRGPAGVTAEQAQACANKSRFRAQHGADDPRVQFIYQKCAAAGL